MQLVFVLGWVLMTVAMLLPTSLPLVAHVAHVRRRGGQSRLDVRACNGYGGREEPQLGSPPERTAWPAPDRIGWVRVGRGCTRTTRVAAQRNVFDRLSTS